MISFTLPAPPSTNQLYSGRRYKTERYKAWISEAGWELKLQRPMPIQGPFGIMIWLPGRIDLDNIKAIPDLLTKMGIIMDDRRRLMRWVVVEPSKDGKCRVEIFPL